MTEYHELYREDTPVVFIQPSTHLDCGFASTAARVNVTWEFEPFEDNDPTLEMLSTTFSIQTNSHNCSVNTTTTGFLTCHRSKLILKKQPPNGLFTCSIPRNGDPISIRKFRFAYWKPGTDLKPMYIDKSRDYISEDDFEALPDDFLTSTAMHMETPNISISYSECREAAHVSCTAYASPVSVYVTSDSDVEIYSGIWHNFATANRTEFITRVGTSEEAYYSGGSFTFNSTVNVTKGHTQYVICNYYQKYAFQRLDTSPCPDGESQTRYLLLSKVIMSWLCPLLGTVVILICWCCCVKSKRASVFESPDIEQTPCKGIVYRRKVPSLEHNDFFERHVTSPLRQIRHSEDYLNDDYLAYASIDFSYRSPREVYYANSEERRAQVAFEYRRLTSFDSAEYERPRTEEAQQLPSSTGHRQSKYGVIARRKPSVWRPLIRPWNRPLTHAPIPGSRRRTKVWLAELDLLKIAIQRHLGSAKSLKPLPFARKKFLRFASLDAGVLALSSAMGRNEMVHSAAVSNQGGGGGSYVRLSSRGGRGQVVTVGRHLIGQADKTATTTTTGVYVHLMN